MKCPHCLEGFHDSWSILGDGLKDRDGTWIVHHTQCPQCLRRIIKLEQHHGGEVREHLARPRATARSSLSSDVPPEFATDYTEACLVLADSPKASAALSRRCLQHILREQFRVKPGKLADEIKEVLPKL